MINLVNLAEIWLLLKISTTTSVLAIVPKWMINTMISDKKLIVSILLIQSAIKRIFQCTEAQTQGIGATIAAQVTITVLKGITVHLGIPLYIKIVLIIVVDHR